MSDQLSMFSPATSPDTDSATSSPASAAGLSQPGSPDGPRTASCGRARRRASPSRKPAKAKPRLTIGICGPTFVASSAPDGPLRSWENRLRQRLAGTGSTECSLTWQTTATPQGRSLSRLAPSTRPTSETDSTLPPMALWITATHRDWKDTPGMTTTRPDGRSRIDQLPRQVFAALLAPAHGTDASGSAATTDGAVEFDPEFARWVMGYPPEWCACAPTETRSSRSSGRK